ncbi:hypothetical protein [Metabacillus arenae]|uniref:Uncharacterized protein n=1 Tax=Metabacillus arenae TaxID=2771434 RepID=A0A926NFV0_9BACI|nr:hypothetical protein [Metabacillus arenae]MBD1379238.1 hypothetical protein [Metabacillus arenae]
MGFRLGTGYIGSPSILISSANEECIPEPPSHWNKKYSLYKFTFSNSGACSIKVNNGSPIYIADGQGFSIEKEDAPITSFVIVEAGVSYNWIGAF